jgi:hypothetical protein
VLVNGRRQSLFTLQSGQSLGAQDLNDDEWWIFFIYFQDVDTTGDAIKINNPNFGTVWYQFFQRVGLNSNGVYMRPTFSSFTDRIEIPEQRGAPSRTCSFRSSATPAISFYIDSTTQPVTSGSNCGTEAHWVPRSSRWILPFGLCVGPAERLSSVIRHGWTAGVRLHRPEAK